MILKALSNAGMVTIVIPEPANMGLQDNRLAQKQKNFILDEI